MQEIAKKLKKLKEFVAKKQIEASREESYDREPIDGSDSGITE